jgi:hypothetical protein
VQRYYDDAYGSDSRTAAEGRDGYVLEPRVAPRLFRRMIEEEPRIRTRFDRRPVAAIKKGSRLAAVTFETPSGERETVRANAFIDATYEGDLMALSGVSYRVGREGRSDYNEPHAGVIYWDVSKRDFLPGSTGEGDKRVQAYNYRLPLTNRSGIRDYRLKPPPGYDPSLYANVPRDVAEGKIRGVSRVLDFRRIPGEEFDVNNNRYYPSTDYVGHSDDYPDADPARRAEIAAAHRRYVEGLIYFLQHDDRLPPSFRFDANQWGLSRDEFRGNDHFPTQLYVREARRMVGAYTFNENDALAAKGSARSPVFRDSIAAGDYMMDSHATRPQEPDRPMGVLEGFFFIPALTKPYQIPYRILVPEKTDGLLVPVAVSATHVGYGTLRMEPVMMAMGEAAGVATQVARRRKTSLRNVPIPELQRDLLDENAVLTYFSDLAPDRPDFKAFQYLGTLGLFDDYAAKPDDPLTLRDAGVWLERLSRAIGSPAPSGGAPQDTSGADAITRAQFTERLGFLGGEREIKSPPDEKLTRGEAAILLYDALTRRNE